MDARPDGLEKEATGHVWAAENCLFCLFEEACVFVCVHMCKCMTAYMETSKISGWTTHSKHSDDFRLTRMFADFFMWAIMHLHLTKLSMIC